MDEHWEHLQSVARRLSAEYPDAVFIGGIAVAAYSRSLGEQLVESSHDADLYLSLSGKAEMRDRYEVRHNPRLGKDSALVEGEEIDVYVEHQHALAIPFEAIIAHAESIGGIRVAALEHLLVLKLDAALDRVGSGKGDKDARDVARLVALLEAPRGALLAPYMTLRRRGMLESTIKRTDLTRLLGLNPHSASRFQNTLDKHLSLLAPPESIDG